MLNYINLYWIISIYIEFYQFMPLIGHNWRNNTYTAQHNIHTYMYTMTSISTQLNHIPQTSYTTMPFRDTRVTKRYENLNSVTQTTHNKRVTCHSCHTIKAQELQKSVHLPPWGGWPVSEDPPSFAGCHLLTGQCCCPRWHTPPTHSGNQYWGHTVGHPVRVPHPTVSLWGWPAGPGCRRGRVRPLGEFVWSPPLREGPPHTNRVRTLTVSCVYFCTHTK